MQIEYTSKLGKITMYGDGEHEISLCELSGLEPVKKSRSIHSFVSEDGVYCDNEYSSQRTITLMGDIKGGNEKAGELARAFSAEGMLTIQRGRKTRIIKVNSSELVTDYKYSPIIGFTLKLTCDYPHFTDGTVLDTYIFKIEKKLARDFVFPGVFSERTSGGMLINSGDVGIYPVIKITSHNRDISENNILIENKSTEASILIEKSIAPEEEIVIDLKNRTVESSVDGNILSRLNLYTALSEFICECGENEIAVTVGGAQKGIEAVITHCNEYAEAL